MLSQTFTKNLPFLNCCKIEMLVLNECDVKDGGFKMGFKNLRWLKKFEFNQTKFLYNKDFYFLDDILNGHFKFLQVMFIHVGSNIMGIDEIVKYILARKISVCTIVFFSRKI